MQNYSESTSTLSAFLSAPADGTAFPSGNYWNIDDILAEEELVPCRFKQSQNNLAFLAMTQKNKAKKAKNTDAE